MILVFLMLSFKPAFSLSSFTLIKRLFSSSSFFAIRMASAYLRLIFLPPILIPACHIVKAMVFPVVMHGCKSWTIKTDEVKSLSRARLSATPRTVAYQASLSMGFSRQKYWSGLPFPSPGNLLDPGIEPRSSAL